MTILIKGIEMPTDPLYPIHATIYADGTVITGHGVGEFAKEAVSVPTPHGRLIDADDFDSRIRAAGGMADEELTDDFKDGVQSVLALMGTQKTVIEAEE